MVFVNIILWNFYIISIWRHVNFLCIKSYMAKKLQKNLYLPDWLIELIDTESIKGKSVGEIAAAAIYAYCTSSVELKAKIITAYSEYVVDDESGRGFDEYIKEIVINATLQEGVLASAINAMIDQRIDDRLATVTEHQVAKEDAISDLKSMLPAIHVAKKEIAALKEEVSLASDRINSRPLEVFPVNPLLIKMYGWLDKTNKMFDDIEENTTKALKMTTLTRPFVPLKSDEGINIEALKASAKGRNILAQISALSGELKQEQDEKPAESA